MARPRGRAEIHSARAIVGAGRMMTRRLAFLKHALQLLLCLQPGHFALLQPGFRAGLLLQAFSQFCFTRGVVEFAVAKFLFCTGQLRVELIHLFFQTGDLFAQRLGLAA